MKKNEEKLFTICRYQDKIRIDLSELSKWWSWAKLEIIWVNGDPDKKFNPVWHDVWKQEKCSSLEPPRDNFYKTQ